MMRFLSLVAFLLILVNLAMAGGTKVWESSNQKDFQAGTFQNTILLSNGFLQTGCELKQIKTDETTLWCHAVDSKGDLYVGTGNRGIIYRLENNRLVQYCNTEQLMVTSLVAKGDVLYAGTLPEGKIFQIQNNKADLLAKLPSPYIWAMKFWNDQIYAATGPNGALYQVDIKSSTIKTLAEIQQKHLLSMDMDEKGNLYVGTAPEAVLYKVCTTGEIVALADFPENELRGLAVAKNKIYIGTNVTKGFDNADMVKQIAQSVEQQAKKGKTLDRKKMLSDMMSGVVYQYEENKGCETLLKLEKNFVIALAVDKQGVLCSTGIEGRIYQIQSKEVYSILYDLKEDQIMDMVVTDGKLQYFGTGDTGVLYKVSDSAPGNSIYWSPVHDAGAISFVSKATWQKEGGVSLQVRTGNTKKPDKYWSEWGSLRSSDSFRLDNAPGRYIQYRIIWHETDGVVKSVNIFYTTQNRPPEIGSFTIGVPTGNRKLFNIERVMPSERSSSSSNTILELSWKTDDEDKDALRYRLWYRNVNATYWYEITANQVFTQNKYKWDTTYVPDGAYIIKLVVSDELENVTPCQTIQESRPVIIDNHPPIVKAHFFEGKVSGSASDSCSFITQMAYRIGNGDWALINSTDGTLDSTEENFEFSVNLSQGSILEVRAIDVSGNIGYTFIQQ